MKASPNGRKLAYIGKSNTCIVKDFDNSTGMVGTSNGIVLAAPPYAYGVIKLDGADTGIVHLIGGVDLNKIKVGMKMEPVYADDASASGPADGSALPPGSSPIPAAWSVRSGTSSRSRRWCRPTPARPRTRTSRAASR